MDIASLFPSIEPWFLILLGVCAIALVLGSITDLRTREVPDFLNYGLIFLGLALHCMLSIVYWDPRFAIGSLLGLSICFGIGWLMFYAGQWGGGDSKMLMGLGSILGLPFALEGSFLLSLLLNILFAGAIYGLLWSIGLVVRNRKRFAKAFAILIRHKLHRRMRPLLLSLLMAFFALLFVPLANIALKISFLWALILLPFMYYVFLFVKSVERSSMFILLPISRITEGDWIAKDVIIRGKRICGPKDLGISKKQINALRDYERRGLIGKVLIKQGIPFIPSFLLAFIFTLIWGNPFTLLVGFF